MKFDITQPTMPFLKLHHNIRLSQKQGNYPQLSSIILYLSCPFLKAQFLKVITEIGEIESCVLLCGRQKISILAGPVK